MTKQEEIREGLMELLDVSTDDYYRTLEGGSLYYIASRILSYLNSRGVVIKVDRELPEDDYPYRMDTFWRYKAFDDGQESMLKARYEAVEPLIEGK